MTWGIPVVTGLLIVLFLALLFEGNNSDWFIVAVLFSIGLVGAFVGFNQSKKITKKIAQLQEDQSEMLIQTDPEQLKNIELTLIEQDELAKKANQLETKLEYAKNNHKESVIEQDYLDHRMKQMEKKRDEEINRFPFLSATNSSFLAEPLPNHHPSKRISRVYKETGRKETKTRSSIRGKS